MKSITIATLGICSLILLGNLQAAPLESPLDSRPLAPQTIKNLETAMKGEAYANLKYQRYADQARAGNNESLAKLFEESANVEASEHFDREATALALGSTDPLNLADAMSGEHYENTKMYVTFADQAEQSGDLKAAALFRQIAADEGDHYEQFKAAMAKLATP